jgi:hypothetical protein
METIKPIFHPLGTNVRQFSLSRHNQQLFDDCFDPDNNDRILASLKDAQMMDILLCLSYACFQKNEHLFRDIRESYLFIGSKKTILRRDAKKINDTKNLYYLDEIKEEYACYRDLYYWLPIASITHQNELIYENHQDIIFKMMTEELDPCNTYLNIWRILICHTFTAGVMTGNQELAEFLMNKFHTIMACHRILMPIMIQEDYLPYLERLKKFDISQEDIEQYFIKTVEAGSIKYFHHLLPIQKDFDGFTSVEQIWTLMEQKKYNFITIIFQMYHKGDWTVEVCKELLTRIFETSDMESLDYMIKEEMIHWKDINLSDYDSYTCSDARKMSAKLLTARKKSRRHGIMKKQRVSAIKVSVKKGVIADVKSVMKDDE